MAVKINPSIGGLENLVVLITEANPLFAEIDIIDVVFSNPTVVEDDITHNTTVTVTPSGTGNVIGSRTIRYTRVGLDTGTPNPPESITVRAGTATEDIEVAIAEALGLVRDQLNIIEVGEGSETVRTFEVHAVNNSHLYLENAQSMIVNIDDRPDLAEVIPNADLNGFEPNIE